MIYELGSGSAASTPHVSPPATTKPVTSTPDTSPAKAWNDAVAQAKANSPQQSANTPAEVVTGVNNSGIKPIITAMAYANAADQNLQETEQNAAKLHVRDPSLFSDGETQSTNSWNTVEQKTINMLMSNNGGAYPEQAAAAEVKQLNALEPGNAKFAAANNAALTEATKQWQQMGVTKPQLSPIINAYSNAKRATNPAFERQAKNQLNAAIEKSLTDAANRAGSNPHARAKAMTERAADIQIAGPQDRAFRTALDNANYDLQVTKPAQRVAKAYNTALVEGRANGLLPDDATTAAAAAAANELKTVTQNAGNSYYAGQIIWASHGTIDTITKDMGSIASEPLHSPGTVLEFNQIYGDLSQSVAAANTANASGLRSSGKDAADLVANCIAKNIPPNLTLDQGSIYDEAAINSIANGDGTGLSLATAAALKQQGRSDLAAFLTVGAARGLQGFASSVTKALTNYQQKTADLNWLIANLGGGATPQQLNTAIQHYINQQGPAWKAAYQQDKTILQASGQNLAVDIAQLEALPSALKTPEVNSTLKSLAGNQSVQQAIGFALANNPVSLVGSDGNQGEALAKFLELDKGSGELAKSSAELATAISQVYLKDHVEPQLLRNLQGLQPGSAKYDAAIAGTLQSFMERHPAMAAVAGLNGESIKKLSQLLPTDPLNKSTSPQQLETEVSGKLELLKKYEEEKGFSLSASHLFNSVALVVGSVGFFGAVKQAINKPDPASVFGAFTAALGFSQSAASAAGLFEKAPSQLRDFSNGESALGDLAGKVINGANLVANIGNLAAALQDGNTLGVVGSSAGAAGTLLKLVPEELVGDALQGGLDIGSDVLTVASAVIGVGQLLFSGPPHPPSVADQLAFLKSEGFGGLSENALFSLLSESNPSSNAPGSSPWKLLVKYAQDKGYNLQDSSQRTAFVTWVNGLAANRDKNDSWARGADGKPVNQLASLVQNLKGELDYSNGNVANFPARDPVSDNTFAHAVEARDLMDNFWNGVGAQGVVDNNSGSSNNVAVVNAVPGDGGLVAPQSAYQIDQLLNIIGASRLPPPLKG